VAGSRRRQVAIDLILATVSGALFVLTLTVPDWIEAVFGIDPDGGNGALEFLLAATFLAVALGAGRFAARALRTS